MDLLHRYFSRAVTLIPLLLLFSCASTQFTSTWIDSKYKGRFLNNVMVIGVSENQRNRRIFEDEFVRQFKSHGVEAVSSAEVISHDKELNKDTIETEARKLGVDEIFVTHKIQFAIYVLRAARY